MPFGFYGMSSQIYLKGGVNTNLAVIARLFTRLLPYDLMMGPNILSLHLLSWHDFKISWNSSVVATYAFTTTGDTGNIQWVEWFESKGVSSDIGTTIPLSRYAHLAVSLFINSLPNCNAMEQWQFFNVSAAGDDQRLWQGSTIQPSPLIKLIMYL